MKPPFTITPKINNLCSEITRLIGKYEGLTLPAPKPELRKHSKILSIQSSLAIEGNTLTIDQVTDIINNKRVLGPKKDILEVKNALKVYELLDEYEPTSLESLLKAHKILMADLIRDAGRLRNKNVAVGNKFEVIHRAPDFKMVPELMGNLFNFLKKEKDLHPIIKSSVFHYEFEFIHPFMDGNGRIGRLWQSVILYDYAKIFEYIPVETIIKRRQLEYYEAIRKSTVQGESTLFIEFMLETIKQATDQFTKSIKPVKQSVEIRLNTAMEYFNKKDFRRKDYLELHSGISPQTATKDLAFAVKNKILIKKGENIKTRYKFN
ncbi:MAG: cell filamentation protein Fic [Candidatus Omnitrophica bacterium CG11_big_fil_rev_8_21_14_0_20_42_13]|uniref:Cell filamentation protein Fic n=1 Tax=Candidatus Ghiorseimicrobium undicola TaxID=1974746 RepID=A0A2H0M0Y0_9BACT|nr:MAG: cell filamentation protein Fic [Candidatus Omnitrophica bacterium CG11_big_fil_rev_8_21_14_0_20_42_13]